MKYPIDFIICIDTSKDMINAVSTLKKRALQFYPDLKEALSSADKEVSQVRLKLILFGPQENQTYLKESDWFCLSNSKGLDKEYFLAAISHIKCKDYFARSNGLEVLARAIKSDWVQVEGKCRQIIGIFTNHPAEKIENIKTKIVFHNDSLNSLEELTDLWMTPYNPQQAKNLISLKQSAKRLIIFSPEVYPWPEIYESWDQVVYNPLKAGTGWDDASYEDLINAVVGSV